jgi:predicted ArsR family transcriptional regulator
MIEKILELAKTGRFTLDQLADKLGTTRQVVESVIELLERKGRIVRIDTGKGIQFIATEDSPVTSEKLTPSALIEYIKQQGFSTITQAASALGSTPDEVKRMLDYLFTKQHVKRVDVAKEHDCAGNCSGCHGCEHAAMIQIDGTTLCYQLKAHNL